MSSKFTRAVAFLLTLVMLTGATQVDVLAATDVAISNISYNGGTYSIPMINTEASPAGYYIKLTFNYTTGHSANAQNLVVKVPDFLKYEGVASINAGLNTITPNGTGSEITLNFANDQVSSSSVTLNFSVKKDHAGQYVHGTNLGKFKLFLNGSGTSLAESNEFTAKAEDGRILKSAFSPAIVHVTQTQTRARIYLDSLFPISHHYDGNIDLEVVLPKGVNFDGAVFPPYVINTAYNPLTEETTLTFSRDVTEINESTSLSGYLPGTIAQKNDFYISFDQSKLLIPADGDVTLTFPSKATYKLVGDPTPKTSTGNFTIKVTNETVLDEPLFAEVNAETGFTTSTHFRALTTWLEPNKGLHAYLLDIGTTMRENVTFAFGQYGGPKFTNIGLGPMNNTQLTIENGYMDGAINKSKDKQGGIGVIYGYAPLNINGGYYPTKPTAAPSWLKGKEYLDGTKGKGYFTRIKIYTEGNSLGPKDYTYQTQNVMPGNSTQHTRILAIYINNIVASPVAGDSANTRTVHLNLEQGEVITKYEAIPVWIDNADVEHENFLPPACGISTNFLPIWNREDNPNMGTINVNPYPYRYKNGTKPEPMDEWHYRATLDYEEGAVTGKQMVFKNGTTLIEKGDTYAFLENYTYAKNGDGFTGSAEPGENVHVKLFVTPLGGSDYKFSTMYHNPGILVELPKTLKYEDVAPVIKSYPNPAPTSVSTAPPDVATIVDFDMTKLTSADVPGIPEGVTYLRIVPKNSDNSPFSIRPYYRLEIEITAKVKDFELPGMQNKHTGANQGINFYLYRTDEPLIMPKLSKYHDDINGNGNFFTDDTLGLTGIASNKTLRVSTTPLLAPNHGNSSFPFTISNKQELGAFTYVKGELDSDWVDNASARVLPGGKLEFKLKVQNTGNVPVKGLKLLDILPHYGDSTVRKVSVPRGSFWTPTFTSLNYKIYDKNGVEKVVPNFGTIKYSDSKNPDRTILSVTSPPAGEWTGGNPTTWTDATSWNGSMADIGSFMFVTNPGSQVESGEYIEIIGEMTAPIGAPFDVPTFNSFGTSWTFNNTTWDAFEPAKGEFRIFDDGKGSIGNFVFLDINENDRFDNDEPGINDIIVELYKADNSAGANPVLVNNQVTINNAGLQSGYYNFSGLDAGFYYLEFKLPTALKTKLKLINKGPGTNPYFESCVEEINEGGELIGRSSVLELTAGQTMNERNAGYKIIDANNGLIKGKTQMDITSIPVSGVGISIYEEIGGGNKTFLQKYFTNEAGSFAFSALDKTKTYTLVYEAPDSMTFKTNNGTSYTVTGVSFGGGITEKIMPVEKMIATGFASISGRVWLDVDSDMNIGVSEPGIVVNVTAYDASDNIIISTSSDSTGKYVLSNLPINQPYKIMFDYSKKQFIAYDSAGGENVAVYNSVAGTTKIDIANLNDVGILTGQNLGLQWQNVTDINIVTFHDINGNGIKDVGELAITTPNALTVAVSHDTDNTPTGSGSLQTSDTDSFRGFTAGNYEIIFTPIGTYKTIGKVKVESFGVTTTVALDGANKIGVIPITRNANPIIYVPLQINPALAKITGDVWFDDNDNGTMDAGEEKLSTPAVELYNIFDNISSLKDTNANLSGYEFNPLSGGKYKLKFPLPVSSSADGGLTYAYVEDTGDSKIKDNTGYTEDFIILDGNNTKTVLGGLKRTATVEYDLNSGTGTIPTVITVLYNGKVTNRPAVDPVRTGYTFGGWYKDLGDASAWDFTNGNVTGNMTLKAKWTLSSYTVTFNTNSGSAIGNETVSHGIAVARPTDPTKAGHTFEDWYSDVGLTTLYNFSSVVTGNIILYAKWTITPPVNHTVTFNTNGGSAIGNATVANGTAVARPTDPTKAGHTFEDWYSDVGLTTLYNFSTAVTSDIILYAKWTPDRTVTFNTNGGSTIGNATVVNGTAVTRPANPTKAGHTFEDWYSDAGLTTLYNFSTAVTSDIILYAKWTPDRTVTFNTNGGSTIGNATVVNGTAVTRPANPTKAGRTFEDWYSDVGLTTLYSFSTAVTGDIILYAKWTITPPVNHTVTFNTNGGSTIGNATVVNGTAVARPANPIKAGHTFEDWYSDVGLTTLYSFSTAVTGDIILYAKWTITPPVNHTVTFNTNGGSTIGNATVVNGTAVTRPANPTKAGHTFEDWYSDVGLTTLYSFSTAVTGDIILYAKWTITPPVNHTVTFNTNGGSTIGNVTVVNGTAVTRPANPTKAGHTFEDWYSDVGLTTLYDFTDPVTADITLYANWAMILPPGIHTVTFNTNGGSAIGNETVANGTAVARPTDPTKAGHTFEDWYSDAGLTTLYSFSTAVTGDITLYAKWTVTPAGSHVVTFNTNGGSAIGNATVANGTAVARPTDPTKAGHTFEDWYSDVGLTTLYDFTDPVTTSMTLYAKWKMASKFPVYYHGNGNDLGGTIPTSGSLYEENTTVTVEGNTGTLDKTGHDFSGWNTEADGSGTDYNPTSTFTITAEMNLYAKWDKKTYTIQYDENISGSNIIGTDTGDYLDNLTVHVALTDLGSIFIGWNTEADGSGTDYAPSEPIILTEDLILYGKWIINPTAGKFLVLYNANGGLGNVPIDTLEYDTGDNADVLFTQLPTKLGHVLLGWSVTPNAVTADFTDPSQVAIGTDNVILYATWDKLSYDVKYVKDGNISDPSTIIDNGVFGSILTLNNGASFNKLNHTLIGWSKDPTDPSEPVYALGGNFLLKEDTIFHAVWRIDVEEFKLIQFQVGNSITTNITGNKVNMTVNYGLNNYLLNFLISGNANGELFKDSSATTAYGNTLLKVSPGSINKIYLKVTSATDPNYFLIYEITVKVKTKTVDDDDDDDDDTPSTDSGSSKPNHEKETIKPPKKEDFINDKGDFLVDMGKEALTKEKYDIIYDYNKTKEVTIKKNNFHLILSKGELKENGSLDNYNIPDETKSYLFANVVQFTDKYGNKKIVGFSYVSNEDAYCKSLGEGTYDLITNIKTFSDISGHWAEYAIKFSANRELFVGTKPGVFDPDVNLSRGMLVSLLYKFTNENTNGTSNPFIDVDESDWYAESVRWAYTKGIIKGVGENKFEPNRDVTREELANVLDAYFNYLEISKPIKKTNLLGYNDYDEISNWAKPSIQNISDYSIFIGTPEGKLNPKAGTTRAEFAVVLQKIIMLVLEI